MGKLTTVEIPAEDYAALTLSWAECFKLAVSIIVVFAVAYTGTYLLALVLL